MLADLVPGERSLHGLQTGTSHYVLIHQRDRERELERETPRDREIDRDRKLTSLSFYKDMNSIGARPQS